MASKPVFLLRAERIAEGQKRLDEAEREVEAAQRAVESSVAEAAGEEMDIPSDQLQDRMQSARQRLDNARQRAEFERQTLRSLIKGETPSPAFMKWQAIGFFLLAAIVLAALVLGFSNNEMLEGLATSETARGLITFLVTIATVAILLILVLSTIVSHSSDRKQRFADGKDLLFALLGVLGTIVGFYFGQATQAPAENQGNPARAAVPDAAGEQVSNWRRQQSRTRLSPQSPSYSSFRSLKPALNWTKTAEVSRLS